ncbi:hypothetical protein AaE_001136 [Aphanomyces astaci]|uniref:MATE efflux family protein n=1 Tax=Aphanomyces astaci TaxID=112090 RepID=A0A6A5ASH2_APHAT|nr:hypothetical protein AaE_001136 [Aphanomyces astaci]
MDELKVVTRLIVPVVFTLLNEYLPAVTNIILVGHLNSPETKEHVAATAISSMLFNITSMSVGLGLATAMDTLCTQALGAGNAKKFGAYLQGGMLAMALVLVPVFVVNWYSGWILKSLHQDATISAMAGTFTRYSTVGLPFLCLYELVKRLLQAHHITWPTAVVAVLGNAIHVGVGYYLVNFTSYGFYGAAIGRSVAYVCLPFLLLPYFWWHPIHLDWNIVGQWSLRDAWASLPAFLEFGVPGMVAMVVEWGAFEILTLFSGLMPDHTVVLGVNSIIMTIISVVYMLFWGVSTAACIRIGFFLGANQPAKAKQVTLLCYAITFGCCLCTALFLVLTRNVLPQLFVEDVDVVQYVTFDGGKVHRRTAMAVLFVIPCHMIDSMNCVTTGVLRAMGKQHVGVVVLTSAYYVVGVPAAALCGLYFGWSVEGLWVGFTLGTTVACFTYALQLRTISWTQLAHDAAARSTE